jgi:hypothetical protein
MLKRSGWHGQCLLSTTTSSAIRKRQTPAAASCWMAGAQRRHSPSSRSGVNLAEDDKLWAEPAIRVQPASASRRQSSEFERSPERQNTRRDLLESVKKIQSYGIE